MVAVPVQSSSRRPRQIHRPSWTEIEDGEINEEAEQIILDALRDSRKNSPMTVASPSSPSGTDTHPPSRGPRSTSGVITSKDEAVEIILSALQDSRNASPACSVPPSSASFRSHPRPSNDMTRSPSASVNGRRTSNATISNVIHIPLTPAELDRAKSVVLDLLGWGVSPEYLIEYGVSADAICRIFTDLRLRLPANLARGQC